MKDNLIKHVKMIFKTLNIESEFFVYDCLHDELPQSMVNIIHTKRYLIISFAIEYLNKIISFIGKEIKVCNDYLYWYEGEDIINNSAFEDDKLTKVSCEIDNIKYLKTNTILPSWLDDYIFKILNAKYAPNHEKFNYNLDLTKEDVDKYLGTYFPRSYCESFCIFDNLFGNETFLKLFNDTNKDINILVVGCGTGGELIGLLTIIGKYCSCKRNINIVAIDGNKESINVLKKVLYKYEQVKSINISLTTIEYTFDDIISFNVNTLGTNTLFDFILCSKMICEIISIGKGLNDNAYYDYVCKFLPMLNDNGVFYLLDVTTKQNHSTYNPILMNSQIRNAIKTMSDFAILSPLPCAIFSMVCNKECFYQKIFTITHSQAINDKSKVAYKLIASKKLIELLGVDKHENNRYLIHGDKICPNTTQNENRILDAFFIPQNIEL